MLSVSLEGLEPVIEKLQQLQARGENLLPLLREIGDDEVTRTLLRFENSKAPDGTSWRPLQSRAGLPLVDSERLRDSIKKQVYGSHAVAVGSDVSYAPYHQFGAKTRNDRWRPPPRPFLGVSDDLIRSMEEFVRERFNL